MPTRAEDLGRYDLVILSNVPAAALPAERMEAIRRYVSELGGGLIAIGGEQSFTPGGYRGTPLEDILPVRSEAQKGQGQAGAGHGPGAGLFRVDGGEEHYAGEAGGPPGDRHARPARTRSA